MYKYEFVFITRDSDKKILKSVEDIITQFEGKIVKKDDWEKRQFSYKINDATEGYYHFWNLEIAGKKIKDLKNRINLEEEIIRYLLLKEE